MPQGVLDLPSGGPGLLVVRLDEGRGQQRPAEAGEQGLGDGVVGDAHAQRMLLGVERHPGDVLGALEDEGPRSGGESLDEPEGVVADDGQRADLGEVGAHEGEVVLVGQPADRADAVHALLIARRAGQGVPGVGRVGDQAAVADHRDDLVDETGLGVDGVELDVARHGLTLPVTALTRPPRRSAILESDDGARGSARAAASPAARRRSRARPGLCGGAESD